MASAAVPTLCAVCGEMQPSRLAYLVHRKTCRVRFPCGQCAETFESKKKLAEHQKAHRVAHVCDMCETEPFRSQARLEEHKCVAHGVLLGCPSCEKLFNRADNRDRRVRLRQDLHARRQHGRAHEEVHDDRAFAGLRMRSTVPSHGRVPGAPGRVHPV